MDKQLHIINTSVVSHGRLIGLYMWKEHRLIREL
jgi:hypothetical protein